MNGSFNELVLAWLRSTSEPGAVSIVSVEGSGNDWAGSTEDGFYETFSCCIRWLDAHDATRFTTVSGEAMASLWQSVIAGCCGAFGGADEL